LGQASRQGWWLSDEFVADPDALKVTAVRSALDSWEAMT
jgi:hypothetical protein